MSYPVIFEEDGRDVVVAHDPDDEYTPIGIAATANVVSDPDDEYYSWLNKDEAEELVVALSTALGKPAPDGEDPAEVIRASTISFNEGLLRLAAVHNKTVSFSYAKGNGAVIEQRRLVPGEVKEIKGHLTFVGYDPDRDDIRAYRVDRMKGEVSIA